MKNDSHLICFFSFGRRELTKKCFIRLMGQIRPQDKLMVIDNGMKNYDLYILYRNKIDFLILFKENYFIGPIWSYIRNFLVWKCKIVEMENATDCLKWKPEYVSIIESDAEAKDGWQKQMAEMLKDNHIGIVSGYDAKEHNVIEERAGIQIRNRITGVQITMEVDYFIKIAEFFQKYGQDKHISIINKDLGKVVAVKPGWAQHLGKGQSTKGCEL